jgi:hypothetical protein
MDLSSATSFWGFTACHHRKLRIQPETPESGVDIWYALSLFTSLHSSHAVSQSANLATQVGVAARAVDWIYP